MIQFNSIPFVYFPRRTHYTLNTHTRSLARDFYRFLFFFCEKKNENCITKTLFACSFLCLLVSFSVSLVCPTKIERLCVSVCFFPISFLDWSILFIFFHFVSTVCICECVSSVCDRVFVGFYYDSYIQYVSFFRFNSSI